MNDRQSETPSGGQRYTPVCAIGASAGGIEALSAFFRSVPTDLGLAYVVVVHLAPDQPSALAEILSGCTAMPVQQIENTPRLAPDTVFVIPPDRELVIGGDDVHAHPFGEPRGHRAPIDMFFRSVAAARGDGIALILSGAGSDGAIGVRAIKEAGGVVLVQEPGEADYAPMPQSAIATGAADFIAPVGTLAERLNEVVRSKAALAEIDDATAEDTVRQIIAFLRTRTGHDFSNYKRATVMRRIARRMQVTRTTTLAAYAAYVRDTPEEAQELFSELLISVTMFFRDPAAFDTLAREAVVPIFDALREGEGIRVWTVGCATGEEAYSLAILFLEEAERRQVSVPIQVFATDLDEGALATGREGLFPASIEANVSEERLRRFFAREGTHYRVRQELRDLVLFASHSVLKDPPFMRLNLISCRNLLIYLERELQRQVCHLLHYGLTTGGYLFLGSAETVEAVPDIFAAVDRETRLYRAKPADTSTRNLVPRMPMEHRRPALPEPAEPAMPRRLATRQDNERAVGGLHVAALERNAPPSVLVAADRRILNLSPTAGRFLLPSAGPFSRDLAATVRPELRFDLRVALDRAFNDGKPTLTHPTPVAFNGASHLVSMQVRPASAEPEAEEPGALVFFMEGEADRELPLPREDEDGPTTREILSLREELRVVQDRLVASRKEHEVAVQDLKAANEELQSINEEYRSASEELETSKEEVQSMNEELQTVNTDLKRKLESISSAHSDLQNLTMANEVGTLFLDQALRIRMFTRRVTDIFNIVQADHGRPITDFTTSLVDVDLAADADRVLGDLAPVEREVETVDGAWLIMRLRPYRTIEDRIEGVVATFVDVTARKVAERRLAQSEERYRTLFEQIDEGFVVAEVIRDDEGRPVDVHYLDANPAAAAMAGVEFAGRRLSEIGPDFEAAWFELPAEVAGTGQPRHEELYAAPLGRWLEMRGSALPAPDTVGITFQNVTERRAERAALEEAQELLTLATAAARVGWGTWDFSSGITRWDARGREILGLAEDEDTVEAWLARVHPEDRAEVEARLRRSTDRRRTFDLECRVVHRDGEVRHVEASGVIQVPGDGASGRGTGLVRDVTEEKRWIAQQELLVGELNHRVKNMLAVIQSIARQTQRTTSSAEEFVTAFEQRVGTLARAHDMLTRSSWEGADLAEVAHTVTTSFTGRSDLAPVTIEGPPVRLTPGATIAFAMAFHELATNALKYGALSMPGGRVRLSWRPVEDRLSLAWEEEGGPPARPPERTGFGSRMLRKGLSQELGGIVEIFYEETGVRCEMELPLDGQIRLDRG